VGQGLCRLVNPPVSSNSLFCRCSQVSVTDDRLEAGIRRPMKETWTVPHIGELPRRGQDLTVVLPPVPEGIGRARGGDDVEAYGVSYRLSLRRAAFYCTVADTVRRRLPFLTVGR